MDIMSLAIGFIVGSFTGATGTYFGNKYTDKRRNKDKHKQNNMQWNDLCKRFPKVINEMKEDVNNPEFINIRTFFVRDSKTVMNISEPSFHYYTDIHVI